jgi:hypothetical protein
MFAVCILYCQVMEIGSKKSMGTVSQPYACTTPEKGITGGSKPPFTGGF